ncbi:acyltransferase family protein [Hymenobacter terrestris]|uniref:Acyltransferase n=1 Tax=Hymenobacter terrestris TaxID=2748310 RepID=A0ABX2Q6R5_9BACT|nr:acyltransferase [Hymenobacter terrestris]NVO86111.1 acyltransferase [Hymenobacter terrestris]
MAQTIQKSPNKLAALEAIRGAAAIYVVIHHMFGSTELKNVVPALIRAPFRFGQEAVITFFLMSGFVIYLATYKKVQLTFRDYFFKRFFRIYPVFLGTLIISVIINFLNGKALTRGDLVDFIGNVFMLQDTGDKPGIFVYPFLHNHALWSLSYEWWFYMLFLPIIWLLSLLRHHFNYSGPSIYPVGAISLLAYAAYLIFPNHMLLIVSYLVLWWAGVACAEIYCRGEQFSFKALKHIYLCLLCMTAATLIPLRQRFLEEGPAFNVNGYPFIDFRHYLFAVLSLAIIQFSSVIKNLDLSAPLRWFSALASISYGLYCVHFPVFLLALPFIHNLVLEYAVKLVLILLLAYLLEMKLQPWWNKLAAKLSASKVAVPSAAPSAFSQVSKS